MVIMRKSDALDSVDLIFEQLTRGLDQIGKKYDFNFKTNLKNAFFGIHVSIEPHWNTSSILKY
jgi:hypothetical protein